MAEFTIRVDDNVSRSNLPYIIFETENECFSRCEVFIPVSTGESRYVEIISDSTFGTPSSSSTVTSDTGITLNIEAQQNMDDTDTEFSNVRLIVRLSEGSSIFYSKLLSRTHSINIC